MKYRLLAIMSLAFGALPTWQGYAQEHPAQPSPYRSVPNPFRAAMANGPAPETLAEPTTDATDTEGVHGPNPEPTPPQWGPLDAPTPPIEIRPRVYEFVGPTQGVSRAGPNQFYRRTVRDPTSVLFGDIRLNAPIDLMRPDGLAPAGVYGDHTLKQSQFLISYRYVAVGYDGNLSGTHFVDTPTILSQYPLAPTRESYQQHQVLWEYGVTDDLTIITRIPFSSINIDYVDATGSLLRTGSTQIGDLLFASTYALKRWNQQQIHLNFGFTMPTGVYEPSNAPIDPTSPHLNYRQLSGSTTWDLLPGLTYRGQRERWSWGAQSIATLRLGRGQLQFRLGDVLNMTGWVSRRWTRGLSTSARLNASFTGPGSGLETDILGNSIDPNLTPANRINLLEGTRLDLLFGINLFTRERRLPGSRFLLEGGFPIYQSLEGPQLRATWMLNGSWNIIW
jgi:hypothetical protein